MPKHIKFTKEQLVIQGYKLINATYNGEKVDKWYINNEGKVFNLNKNLIKGNFIKIKEYLEKGRKREPFMTFTYNGERTKRTIKQLLNTYFPTENNDYKILTHYYGKKLFSPLKVYKSGEIFTMSSVYSNINSDLIIFTNPIDRIIKYRTDKDGYKLISITYNNKKKQNLLNIE